LLLGRELAIFHISKMILGTVLVLVELDKEVFRELQGDGQ
jgi:hypothetical protein